MQRLATEHGCRLRVTGQSIVIFSALRGDSLSPLVITRAKGDQFTARRTITDVYSKVVITYTDPASGKTIRYSFEPDDAPVTGKTLTLNKRVENEGQAQRVALAALREKNSKGKSGDWQGQANPLARAGATVRFEEWGVYGGLYGIEEAEHELGGNGAAITRLRLAETLGY